MDEREFFEYIQESRLSIPEKWDDLNGPYSGVITLPHHVDWSPGSKKFDISTRWGAQEAYMSLLSDGTVDDICYFINGDRLKEIWNILELRLPKRIRTKWESKFDDQLARC